MWSSIRFFVPIGVDDREDGTTYGFYTILQHSQFGFKFLTYLVSKDPLEVALSRIGKGFNPRNLRNHAVKRIEYAKKQASQYDESRSKHNACVGPWCHVLFPLLRAAEMTERKYTQSGKDSLSGLSIRFGTR